MITVIWACYSCWVSDRGVLVIVSSPSGAGKTTLTRRLLEEFGPRPRVLGVLHHAADAARRDRRPRLLVRHARGVRDDGRARRIRRARVRASATATAPRRPRSRQRSRAGRDVDLRRRLAGWRGAVGALARDSLKIFILPPDLTTLEARLRQRATDAPEVIERRLRKANDELAHYTEYQHLIVNDDLERAYAVLRAIYLTRRFGVGRSRRCRPTPLADARDGCVERQPIGSGESHARRPLDVTYRRTDRDRVDQVLTIAGLHGATLNMWRSARGVALVVAGLRRGMHPHVRAEAIQPNPLAHPTETLRNVREDHDRHRRHGSRPARSRRETRVERSRTGSIVAQPSLPADQPGELHDGVARSAALPRPGRSQVGGVRRPQARGTSSSIDDKGRHWAPESVEHARTQASSPRCGIASSARQICDRSGRDGAGNCINTIGFRDDGWRQPPDARLALGVPRQRPTSCSISATCSPRTSAGSSSSVKRVRRKRSNSPGDFQDDVAAVRVARLERARRLGRQLRCLDACAWYLCEGHLAS